MPDQKVTILERIKQRPIVSALLALATVFGAITTIITGLEKIDKFMDNNIVKPSDLLQVKKDIVEEFRKESADIRRIYITDLQEQIEELEDTLELTTNTGKQLVITNKIQELRVRIARLQGVGHE